MNRDSPQVHRVERVDDTPVLFATFQRLKGAETLDRHFPSGHRWKGELTFGEVACVWIAFIRSEEHTSELQSHLNIVCRLLLEKKKTNTKIGRKAPRVWAIPDPVRCWPHTAA